MKEVHSLKEVILNALKEALENIDKEIQKKHNKQTETF